MVFVSDRVIARYNRRYLGRRGATDVLSFPMDDPFFLGDVVISLDTAERQAKKAKRSLREECLFLLIHGLLHLVGYDHAKKSEERIMKRREGELLSLCE